MKVEKCCGNQWSMQEKGNESRKLRRNHEETKLRGYSKSWVEINSSLKPKVPRRVLTKLDESGRSSLGVSLKSEVRQRSVRKEKIQCMRKDSLEDIGKMGTRQIPM